MKANDEQRAKTKLDHHQNQCYIDFIHFVCVCIFNENSSFSFISIGISSFFFIYSIVVECCIIPNLQIAHWSKLALYHHFPIRNHIVSFFSSTIRTGIIYS